MTGKGWFWPPALIIAEDRVSRLAEDIHEIRERDLNPVIALPPGHGCRVVDARIRVSTGSQSAPP